MARIAWAVSLGIPHHITRREYRRHGSGNEYGVPGTWARESAPDDSSLGDLPDVMKGRVASRVFVSRETREGRGPQCH